MTAVRRGACDVADGDGGGSFACGQFPQRFAAYGSIESVGQRGLGIAERRGSARVQHLALKALGN